MITGSGTKGGWKIQAQRGRNGPHHRVPAVSIQVFCGMVIMVIANIASCSLFQQAS
jgi:hypothetical protein